MSKAIQKANKWTDEQITTIKNTVAKGATDEELSMFLHTAQANGLDPILKEIWFIKMSTGPVIFTSRDGYLKIGHSHESFEGMVSDVIYEGDTFKRVGLDVNHEYSSKRGQIIGAYAIVYRSDKRVPTYVYAPMKDYDKKNTQWKQYPHAMILKVAEAMTLKRAFSISGLVSKEELDMEELEPVVKSKPQLPVKEEPPIDAEIVSETKPAVKKDPIKQDPRIAVWNKFMKHYLTQEAATAAVKEIVKDKPSKEWTDEDVQKLNAHIEKAATENTPYGSKEEDFKGIAKDKEDMEELRSRLKVLFLEYLGFRADEFQAWLKDNFETEDIYQLDYQKLNKAYAMGHAELAKRDRL